MICSKSPWNPAIRREHELARIAAGKGHEVVFVERPRDIRALGGADRRAWAKGLGAPRLRSEERVTVSRRSTLIPGHRGRLASSADALSLGRSLSQAAGGIVVGMVPWEWPAVSRCSGARRVFDCADNWSQVLPQRRSRMLSLYRRIASEADAIVCATEKHAKLFAPREVSVVRNGTPAVLLASEPTARPETRRMVYSGTLSERFDAPLVDAVLAGLPDWRLDLYGPCQYAGCGEEPGADLAQLLARWPSRATWHGPVERDRLVDLLDTGDVLVIPHRRHGAVGGDAMKFYDYAARGRPVVTTPWSDEMDSTAPPHTHMAATPEAFSAALLAANAEPDEFALQRRRWAEANSWQARWQAWSDAVIG
jgi:hypothetical protein